MSGTVAAAPARATPATVMLVAGIVLAALTEAIAGTVLALGRGDINGDIAATPDESAWLDIGYTVMKLLGFMTASALMHRFSPRNVLAGATSVMGIACGVAAITTQLDLLAALRLLQGFAGGTLLVAGQAILFLAYPSSRQPLLQAVFALGAVVAPAAIAPALEGWFIDTRSWTWIFASIVPLALAAAGLVLIAAGPTASRTRQRPFDWIGLAMISVALFCLTYVLTQGSRWDWFEEARILWLTTIGAAALLAFLGRQAFAGGRGLLDVSLFASPDFAFAFIVSFVAGAALFGSAFLIPSFAVSVLGFTPTDAGMLLLPSGAFFAGALLLAAVLMQYRRVPPIATVPFGIGLIMLAMWLLAGSTSESGANDMNLPLLLRGLGLGFLFLSITLIAFGHLKRRNLAAGIGLFNTGRLLGGLLGVAGLQTLIHHEVAGNAAVIGTHITAGNPIVAERLATTTTLLVSRGMEAAAASRAATGLLGRTVASQSTVLAYDTAFAAVALLFVFAAPVLVATKIGFALRAKARAARSLAAVAERSIGNIEVSGASESSVRESPAATAPPQSARAHAAANP